MTDQYKYEEWLSCIANTRLIFNTITELEDFLEAPSIHNNGIKRCFTSFQRIRSAFRDLSCEVDDFTNGSISLKLLLKEYKEAWDFYKDNLDRRSDPYNVALALLKFHYPPFSYDKIGKKKFSIFEEIEKRNISIPFIILFLLKVIPGYDSKNGDITNIDYLYATTLKLLEEFTEGSTLYDKLPVIISAKEEPKKTRISLIYHVYDILNTYDVYAEQESRYEVSDEIKAKKVNLDIEGYWNECEGKLINTSFWQIESTIDEGSYFATLWQKDANNNLTGIRYTLFLLKHPDGNLIAYMMHPEAIKSRIKGLAYTDKDHVWYSTSFPINNQPLNLPFKRQMASSVWKINFNLTRVTDQKIKDVYDNWFNTCKIQKPYGNLEYTFIPNIYAITQEDIYIPTEDGEKLYKVPKSSFEGFEQIHINDSVGLLKMEDKTYFAFDEFLLYLQINSNTMKKYGITIVDSVC